MTHSLMTHSLMTHRIVGLMLAFTVVSEATAQAPRREPLPIADAIALRGHNARSAVALSPDGQWIAHTIQGVERVPRDTSSTFFSATGFPFAEGDARMEATITHARTGEVIRLGAAGSASWAPVWSPDGRRVAFYSDEGGEAGIWVWELATRKSVRFPGVIARPLFGFEHIRWMPDGQRIVAKILPRGMSIAEANIIGATRRASTAFPPTAPGTASVRVRRVEPPRMQTQTAASPTTAPGTRLPPAGDLRWAAADLAVLDLRSNAVTVLVEGKPVRTWAVAPAGDQIAYTVNKGGEPNTQQPNFDIAVISPLGGASRTLATDVRLAYATEWNWSPDGRALAYIESGQLGTGEIVVLSLGGDTKRQLKPTGAPNFSGADGEYPPLWSHDARHIFATAQGQLWRIDVATGNGTRLDQLPDWQIRSTVTPYGNNVIWSNDGGRTVWVIGRNQSAGKAGILSIDVASGRARAVLDEVKTYSAIFNVSASARTGEIAFVSSDLRKLAEVWLFDPRSGAARQGTHINAALEHIELGSARLIEWKDDKGTTLRGALLLPPGYREGTRLPLVVDVYGGENGSRFINSFALGGGTSNFNMHLLATRGFAVLKPDAPVSTGSTMTDIMRTVMPGVDAAIAQGFVDADRLAVMGQSYGSFNTLSIITQTPRFKAAVITAAVLHPDLATDYLRATGYYEQGQGNMGGSLWEQRDRYIANSPLYRFHEITTPLLIGQGERDGDLVPSEAIFAALDRLKKPVEYRLYQGEGHVLTQPANVLDFWKRRLEFFAEHLDLTYDATGAIVFDGPRVRSRRGGD